MNKVKLGEVLIYEQPTKYIVESDRYNDNYKTPVLTAGKSFLLGYTDETEGVFNDLPVIIFDDFTTAIKFVDFPFKVKSSAMKILKPNKEKADIRFLYYKMLTIKTDSEQHKRYWISKYSQIQIPLPPLPTQKNIAAKLDKAQEIIAYNKQLLEKYDQLTQALFIEMFGDPVKNEKGWEQMSLKDVCSKILGGGTPSKSIPENFIGTIPWVTPKDMKLRYISDSRDHVNMNAVNNSSAKIIPENSLLMVIRSGILKHSLPIAINTKIVTINQDMKAFIPNPRLTNVYFLYAFFESSAKFLLQKVRAVTADNIEFNQIKYMNFPMVPLRLQNKFAERVEKIEIQKKLVQDSLAKSEELFQSLLKESFS